jgi:hypothetical protein
MSAARRLKSNTSAARSEGTHNPDKLPETPASRGFRAACAAGRRPVDFTEYGPVDRAVFAEIGRYQTQPRKSVADRARLRAALIPFFHLSGVAS